MQHNYIDFDYLYPVPYNHDQLMIQFVSLNQMAAKNTHKHI